jgi:hypothetical protein
MTKKLGLFVTFVILAAVLVGCGTPPPLRSDKYLKDTSLLSVNADEPLAYDGIIPGKTTYADALTKIKADTNFANVQSQDKPPAASWTTKDGEFCCQMSADEATGIINALAIKVAPDMTAKQVIDKFGEPKYVTPVDYTDKEVALTMIYPEKGLAVWVSPGDATSSIAENSPVIMVLYINPSDWKSVEEKATLFGWNGFQTYGSYKTVTPVVTPAITPTAQ